MQSVYKRGGLLGLITIYSRVPIPVKPWLTVVGDGDDECMCSICWDSFCATGERVLTPCGHPFHEECLARWGRLNRTCPYCRGDLWGGELSFVLLCVWMCMWMCVCKKQKKQKKTKKTKKTKNCFLTCVF